MQTPVCHIVGGAAGQGWAEAWQRRWALGPVLALHLAALGFMAAAGVSHPIPPSRSKAVELRLLNAGLGSRQPRANAPLSAVKAPPLQALPQPRLRPAPAWSPEPVDGAGETVAAAVAGLATPRAAALLAATPEPARLPESPAPKAESPRPDQAAALPPEHGACSARGVERFYPLLLRERGVEGRVLVRVQVDERGRAAAVVVQGGSGWRLLDEAARQVALLCPYLPARRGNQEVASWVEYPVQFALGRAPP